MKLLFLLPHPPFPADRGNKHHTLGLLRHVAREHQCDIVGYEDGEGSRPWDALPTEVPGVRVLATFPLLKGFAAAVARVRRLVAGEPWALGPYVNPAVPAFLRGLDLGSYDAVVFDMFMTAWCRGVAGARPTVLIGTDAYSMAMARAARESKGLTAAAHGVRASLQRRFERRHYPRFDAVACVSEIDNAWLGLVAPGTRTRVVGIPLPHELLKRDAGKNRTGRRVVCWGLHSDPVVAAGAMDFVLNGWPAVRAAVPDAELVVWGNAPVPALRAAVARSAGAVLLEFAEDWIATLGAMDVLVYPQRCGSGLQTKIQAAMALRVPTLLAPETVGGLGFVDGKHGFVCNSAGDFARACVRLLRSPAQQARIGAAARRLVLEHFHPRATGDQFIEVVADAIAHRAARGLA